MRQIILGLVISLSASVSMAQYQGDYATPHPEPDSTAQILKYLSDQANKKEPQYDYQKQKQQQTCETRPFKTWDGTIIWQTVCY